LRLSSKSRVFISCGQSKKTEELTTAKRIADMLEKMGFEPYIAVEEQTLKGVKENIFQRLENSEYFLFIDFKRERLFKGRMKFVDTGNHRGSLFSHQELAVAASRDYEVLAFREEGVKKDDGILGFIQANCIPFSDRQRLPDAVVEKVKERGWKSNWRNELVLKRSNNDFQNAQNLGVRGRYYHIKVINGHKDRIARNCVAYVEKIRNLTTRATRKPELVELKWKGITTIGVSVAPRSFRYLDAFHINIHDQTTANLGLNPHVTDWQGYMQDYQVVGPGDYELDYVVFSEDFSPARTKFRLHIGNTVDDVRFVKCRNVDK